MVVDAMSGTPKSETPAPPSRLAITPEAAEVLRQLRDEHGPVLFHQSGGCCDGSAPMCLAVGDLRLGAQDLFLGEVEGCPFYIARDTFRYYANCKITLDVTAGRGASFSLEIPRGVRFLTVSTLLTEAEVAALGDPPSAE